MRDIDFIFIAQSETVDYPEYSKLPLDRIELYSGLIFPRMVYYKGAFRSHLDIINYLNSGMFFQDSDQSKRRSLLNIWNLPGMNIMHIPGYLSRHGILSQAINNFDAGWDLFCRAYDDSATPPLVGLSTTFYLSYAEVKRITKKIRDKYPAAEITLGGAFTNERMLNNGVDSFERPMREYGIKYILHALNSESDLKDLLIARKNKSGIGGVSNIAYIEGDDLKNGKFNHTTVKWNPPVLDRELVLPETVDTSFINHTIQMRTSYGCPFSCEFCSYPAAARDFIETAPEDVKRYVEGALRIPGVNNIIFIDDTMNASGKRFKDLCRVFCDCRFGWFAFLRAQFLDDDTCKLMKDSGCMGVYLGIESANDAVLKNMNKKATCEQLARGLKLLKKYGITSVAAFIIGFPGETAETIKDDIKFIDDTEPDFYTLKEFYYMKHAPIYRSRNKFDLTGMGAKWSHKTMDYNAAHENKVKIFKDVKGSVFIDPDTSMWYVAYLHDQGYGIGEIKDIQKELNNIMADQINGIFNDSHPSFGRLGELFSARTVRTC